MSNSDSVNRSREIRYFRVHFAWVLAKGHVREVQSQRTSRSPGNWRRYSVKCSIARRDPFGVGMNGRRGNRQDARALPTAFDAVLVLAATHRRHALKVNDWPRMGQAAGGWARRSGHRDDHRPSGRPAPRSVGPLAPHRSSISSMNSPDGPDGPGPGWRGEVAVPLVQPHETVAAGVSRFVVRGRDISVE